MRRSAVGGRAAVDLYERATTAWRQAAPGSPAPVRVDLLRPSRKAAVYRLAGVGPEGSDVIAKRCTVGVAAVERLVYEEYLARAPVTTLHLFGHAADQDSAFCWLFIEDAGDGEYRRDLPEHRALAGRWLGRLQAAALGTGVEARLPSREPTHYLTLLGTARRDLRPHLDNESLTGSDIRMLEDLLTDLDRLESRWDEIERRCALLPRTLVHGDLAFKNVRVRASDGSLAMVAFDWENSGWGVPGTDLVQFIGRTISPDLDTYRAAHPGLSARIDVEALRRVAECGVFFRLLDAIAWLLPLPATRSYRYLSSPMAELRIHRGRLHTALLETGWAR